MHFIHRFFHKILQALQLVLILIFIIFEEIIWEGIAQPIYNYFHGLNLVQRLETHLAKVNSYVALFIFIILLIIVEAAGIVSGILLVNGQLLVGGFLYIAKIPLAAVTFWIFKVTKFKMLSFDLIAWAYKRIMAFMKWLKALETYQDLMAGLSKTKEWLKKQFKAFKERFLPQKSGFFAKLQSMYKAIKNRLNTTQKSQDETNPTQTKK
ncbi:MAG: hypothetical protein JXQ76_00420 [Campylobacterales bacterium]|nr:hypothetical protein [Campylobacterales bacterium]